MRQRGLVNMSTMVGSPWIVVVVRAWRHGDDRVVRMTLGKPVDRPVVHYESSASGAGRQLSEWLEAGFSHPPIEEASGAVEEPARHNGDATVTREGRGGSDDAPTVSGPRLGGAPPTPPDGSDRHKER